MFNLFKTLKYTFPKSILYLLCPYYFQDTYYISHWLLEFLLLKAFFQFKSYCQKREDLYDSYMWKQFVQVLQKHVKMNRHARGRWGEKCLWGKLSRGSEEMGKCQHQVQVSTCEREEKKWRSDFSVVWRQFNETDGGRGDGQGSQARVSSQRSSLSNGAKNLP